LQKITALEKSSEQRLERINLLEARVETLEQDNSALQERAYMLQEKTKTLAKEMKGISSSFGACSLHVVLVFGAHVHLLL